MKHLLKFSLLTTLMLVFVQISTAQTWSEQQIIESPNSFSDGTDQFGDDVYIVGDLAVVGNIYDEISPNQKGSVKVYNLVAGNWLETATLTPSDNNSGRFGKSVSISESGDKIIVGASGYDDVTQNSWYGSNVGAAYIFEFEAGQWVEKAKLLASNLTREYKFGYSVAISDDVAIVGDCRSSFDPFEKLGNAVYVFEKNNGIWQETAILNHPKGKLETHFAESIAAYGNRILIGAFTDSDSILGGLGSAFIFDKNNNNEWEFTTQINGRGSDPNCDKCNCNYFGFSVSLTNDRAIVGAYNDKEFGEESGAAFIFDFVDSQWIQTAKIGASDPEDKDNFGYSVSISGDIAIVGAPQYGKNEVGKHKGSAYIFNIESGLWQEKVKLNASDGKDEDLFGISVGISDKKAIVGAVRDWKEKGSVYFYGASMFQNEDEMIKDTQEDFSNILNLGIQDKIGIYPNPASDVLNLYSSDEATKNIKIISLDGTLSKTFQMNQSKNINVSDLSSGMYFLEIESNNEIVRQKFMVL